MTIDSERRKDPDDEDSKTESSAKVSLGRNAVDILIASNQFSAAENLKATIRRKNGEEDD